LLLRTKTYSKIWLLSYIVGS